MARGKKPTVAQRKVLEQSNVDNIRDYLYVGIRYKDPDGFKAPSKNQAVAQQMVFVNKITGEEIGIPM